MSAIYQTHKMITVLLDGKSPKDEDAIYTDTVENFNLDSGKEIPALPEGALEQAYEPGRRHALSNRDGVIPDMEEYAPREWTWGDAVIKQVFDLLIAQSERQHNLLIAELKQRGSTVRQAIEKSKADRNK